MFAFPPTHRAFFDRALAVLQADPRVRAVLVSGSAVTGGMDEWSDLDLVVLVADEAERALWDEHVAIVGRLGPLLSAFRADHFGEPRLLICLYDAPLLHVDVKFMAWKDAPTLTYPTAVAWSRDGAAPELPPPAPAGPPRLDVQWCADRLPGWAHYLAVKIGRGELYEAVDSLDFLRRRVLAPLLALEAGVAPRALRRLEETRSPRLDALARTVCAYDAAALKAAAREGVTLGYALLDAVGPDVRRNRETERKTLQFLEELAV